MAFTGVLGSGDSELGNIVPGNFTSSSTFGFAQAQAVISNSMVFGQAQSDILVTSTSFSQTQTLLNQHFGLAQTQTLVNRHFGIAQAQSQIIDGYGGAVIALGPLAYWRLDETSGTAISDYTGNNANGTIRGTYTLGAAKLHAGVGTAISFNGSGSSDIQGTGSNLPVGTNAAFSFVVWVTPANGGSMSLFTFGASGGGAGTLRGLIQFNNHVYFWGDNNDYDTGVAYTSKAMIVATFDGSTLKMYQNGSQIGTNQSKSFNSTSQIWNMGLTRNIGNFNGSVDDIAVYNYALSSTQVSNLYTVGTDYSVRAMAQAQVLINNRFQFAQAQALIIQGRKFAQAQALLNRGFGLANARPYILSTTNKFGQAQTKIFSTFPILIENGTGTANSVTSTSVTIPATAQAGDLMIITQNSRNTGNYIWPSGWTSLLAQSNLGTSVCETETRYRFLDGTESSPVVINNNGWSGDVAWIRYIIRGAKSVESSGYASFGSTDPPNLSPSWSAAKTLWIALSGNIHNPSVTTYPTSYGNHVNPIAGDTTIAGAVRSLNASSDDPSAFVWSSSNSQSWAATIAVQPLPTTIAVYGQVLALLNRNFALAQAQTSITTTAPSTFVSGQAQANIQGRVFAQSQADIKATATQFAQSNTDILILGNNRFAQTAARILRLEQRYAQAQVFIIQVVFAQAQAKLNAYGVNAFGQSNTDIKATVNKVGQTQSDIKQTYRVYGQSAVVIRNKFWTSAQSNALIRQLQYRGSGQASTSIKATQKAYAQARALLLFPHTDRGCGQAQALIGHFVGGQAQGYLSAFGVNRFAQTQAKIKAYDTNRFGQALTTLATRTKVSAQASFTINKRYLPNGNAQCYVIGSIAIGQAQAQIHFIAGTPVYAQAQGRIVGYRIGLGSARVKISRSIAFANAQGLITTVVGIGPISQQVPGKLVKYNNYILPGYLQSESLVSTTRVKIIDYPYKDSEFVENIGLENKILSLKLLVLDRTYALAKEQVLLASTMLRSNKDSYSKLYSINSDRYYLARTQNIKMEQTAGVKENSAIYDITFECKPWRYGDTHTITGTTLLDTSNVGRNTGNGTWTYAKLTLTGNDITVSGYTSTGQFTGFVNVRGLVSNFMIDSEAYTSDDDSLVNYEYQMLVGPGRNFFAVTGATDCTIEWQDRWEL